MFFQKKGDLQQKVKKLEEKIEALEKYLEIDFTRSYEYTQKLFEPAKYTKIGQGGSITASSSEIFGAPEHLHFNETGAVFTHKKGWPKGKKRGPRVKRVLTDAKIERLKKKSEYASKYYYDVLKPRKEQERKDKEVHEAVKKMKDQLGVMSYPTLPFSKEI